jgi:hypothetical protein
MPRTCTLCSHPDRPAIDAALVSGTPFRNIAERHGVSVGALFRHQDHLSAALLHAREIEQVAQADDLLAQVRDLQRRTLRILDGAERAGDRRTALAAIREARRNLELLGRLASCSETRQSISPSAVSGSRFAASSSPHSIPSHRRVARWLTRCSHWRHPLNLIADLAAALDPVHAGER